MFLFMKIFAALLFIIATVSSNLVAMDSAWHTDSGNQKASYYAMQAEFTPIGAGPPPNKKKRLMDINKESYMPEIKKETIMDEFYRSLNLSIQEKEKKTEIEESEKIISNLLCSIKIDITFPNIINNDLFQINNIWGLFINDDMQLHQ